MTEDVSTFLVKKMQNVIVILVTSKILRSSLINIFLGYAQWVRTCGEIYKDSHLNWKNGTKLRVSGDIYN